MKHVAINRRLDEVQKKLDEIRKKINESDVILGGVWNGFYSLERRVDEAEEAVRKQWRKQEKLK